MRLRDDEMRLARLSSGSAKRIVVYFSNIVDKVELVIRVISLIKRNLMLNLIIYLWTVELAFKAT